jgi:hypothetical protein
MSRNPDDLGNIRLPGALAVLGAAVVLMGAAVH